MIAGALLCAIALAHAAPDVVFLGRAETRASSRSNSVDVLTPAFDVSAAPALQINYDTRRLQSQLLLTSSLQARITLDALAPVQPLFSQRLDGNVSTGEEERGMRIVASGSAAAGILDVNTAEDRLGQPFGLNLGAGAVPLIDASARLTASTQPFRPLRLSAWTAAAFLAAPAADALGGGVALGDDIVGAFTSLVPQLRPEIGMNGTYFLAAPLSVGAALVVDAAVTNEAWQYAGALATVETRWLPFSNAAAHVEAGVLVAAETPAPSLSVWPLLRGDAAITFGAPETLLPGGGLLGGGRTSLGVSAGLEPQYDPFLLQVNWQGRLDMSANYLPSPRLDFGLSAGLYTRIFASLPPKDGAAPLLSAVGIPQDNGANQIGVLTARMIYRLSRNLTVETGILGTARISLEGQTAPQVSVYVALSGSARDDDAIDLVGDIWRSFY